MGEIEKQVFSLHRRKREAEQERALLPVLSHLGLNFVQFVVSDMIEYWHIHFV